MRILILSNFYPPARPGGYTQWCYEVAQRLQQRGHTIGVLTSRHERQKAPAGEQDIFRDLHLEGDLFYYQPIRFFAEWRRNHRYNLARTQQVIEQFKPDIIFVWGMWAMSTAVPAQAEKLRPGCVAYFLSDYWPAAVDMHTAFWQRPTRHRLLAPAKQLLGAAAEMIRRSEDLARPSFRHVICVSQAVKEILLHDGIPIPRARVIHGGTDIERFAEATPRRYQGDKPLRLLYAGQLVDHKGVHTAVAAMHQLVNKENINQVHLTILGSGHPGYEAGLHEQVERYDLERVVDFETAVSREAMPAKLELFDTLIFPSIYDEPLARMTQEAMAAGLAVIGTTTGGTGEILSEGETGLTFPAEDADALARQIARLINEPSLVHELAQVGQRAVFDYFNLDRMVDEIEHYLMTIGQTAEPASVAL